jgi:hypothetical protein
MSKKEEEKKEQEEALIAARDANRPIAAQDAAPLDAETASHQWQAGSAAVNTNVLSDHPTGNDSILDKVESKENLKAKADAEKAALDALPELEDDYDCSKLDVSDLRYCQPGSERHKAFLKKK